MSRSLFNRFDRLASNVSSVATQALDKRQQSSLASSAHATTAHQYYAIRVVDATTNRGVPLVYLRTTYKTIYMTDSAGYVAFNEPGLMTGDPIWVTVSSYGFESPTGFLGVPGMQIQPKAGGSIEIKLNRTQVAERLYRLTGFGVYRDSVLLGKPVPVEQPVLNAKVAGSDTIQCAKFHGKLLWMWQDTDQLAFQLGNFAMTGARTELPHELNADKGLNFDYFTKDNKPNEFTRGMVDITLQTPGSFPLWVDGLTVVPDDTGRERLIGTYCASGPGLSCVERGLVIWKDKKQILEKLVQFDGTNNAMDVLAPWGHTIYVNENGTRYAFYGKNIRVKADFNNASQPSQYEAFTCLTADGQRANRGPNGALIWSWVKGGKPVNYENADSLVQSGVISQEESPYRLRDLDTGQAVTAHTAGIAWNPYLKLWTNVFQQSGGDTTAGEIWFSTAQAPEGPWTACRKVATHYMSLDGINNNNNDLYNPVQHYELMREGGRYIYFSGTLTNTFSGNPFATPYYNYNNIMYRLDLNDSRLRLPQPPAGYWGTRHDESC
ncbi:hypothetical protein N8I77_007559 [Diaporthe amygdali]|uniref:Uncharacterized protein n=1 Tax=Phomopsis amygdali TaxID=1214568 RepID=A0AAD9SEM2_PHOAM|nr:uncharacterized protein J7T55_014193 [Diaporthe amygdali]KAJ0109631.1 hypothetical protein J7T55_014193 [Diaporthe amygdali]KAK2604646.1 hypothetical protein N8I77_007559 [Diaporthe amygdali]